jgi:Fe-S cluster assembly protein SufD
MTALTPDAARALPGSDQRRAARAMAAERARGLPLPSPEDEIWRYSRIAELDLDAFTPVGVEVTVTGADGYLVADDDEPQTVSTDVFGALNDAFGQVVRVRVPPGTVVAQPIVVSHRPTIDASACFPHLVVEAGEDAEVTVVERFSSADVHALVVPVTELAVAPAARLRYLAVNELGTRVWQIGHQVARGDRDSTTLLATVALGGDYARVRTDARLSGKGATGDQVAAYFGEGTQMHDFRTLQDHAAPKTTSDLLFKGVVQGHARSVYTGLIHVHKDAAGTNAFQTNRNLKLSADAWAESVPNLEIENNDVRCSHASAVGPVDEDQRFYLESRGVPPVVAERLIVLGFFEEVLARLPAPGLVPGLRSAIAAKLDRREPA